MNKKKTGSIDKDQYTIQILASHNLAKLERFKSEHSLGGKVKIITTKRQGKNWYILTLGTFEKKYGAQKTMALLPKEIAQFSPWIRKIAPLNELG